jgi:hypothetical protein
MSMGSAATGAAVKEHNVVAKKTADCEQRSLAATAFH